MSLVKNVSLLHLLFTSLYAGVAVVPNDEQYYTYEKDGVELIYTEQNKYAAEQTLFLEKKIHKEYQDSYGYTLDSTLHVGLISANNQIANGFSTQFPLNMQINYMGGALASDYFSSTSWLNTLLYHESAHNYQLNAKASDVTRGMHDVFGNSFLLLGLFPLTTVPNVMLSSYLLEGNAVLNESWHGNGGRLYSGRFKAETIMQAREDNIRAEFLFNQNIYAFPYYDRHYIIGGFFQLYLAEKYGLAKVNSFFYNHSETWLWPFQTNYVFYMTFGHSFEQELKGFKTYLNKEQKGFIQAEGEVLIHSQSFMPLNNDKEKIYFLSSDERRSPELVEIMKETKILKHKRESFFKGKVFKHKEKYYTLASGFDGPTKIYQGLFDKDAKLLESTGSKVIQGYLRNGDAVYFDVNSSFDQPQLYVQGKFYAQVNSFVHIDSDDNLYYFKQEGKIRTLYKNRELVYQYEGYYGLVSDVDRKGNVYFVANSQKGSSLFRLDENGVKRVLKADNIVEARLLNENEVFIAAVGGKEYYYLVQTLEEINEEPYALRYFFEDASAFKAEETPIKEEKLSLDKPYKAPLNLHYAGTQFSIAAQSSEDETIVSYSLDVGFYDPLLNNRFSLFSNRGFDKVGLVGLAYSNNAYLLEYGMSVYGIYSKADDNTYRIYDPLTNTYSPFSISIPVDSRNYGLSTYVSLPLIKSGYDSASLSLNYYQDYDNNARSPLVLKGDISHIEKYGISMFNNYENSLSVFGSSEREDLAYGLEYFFKHDLAHMFYFNISLKGVKSDYKSRSMTPSDADFTRGVKFTNYINPAFDDPTVVIMPSLSYTRFVKKVNYGELALKKQFDGKLLYYTFPLSLTREAIYTKFRHYDVQELNYDKPITYNESTLGATAEFLLMNKLPISLSVEYIYNDNTQEKQNYRFYFGTVF